MLPFSYPTSADEWQNIGLGLTAVAFTVAFALAAGNTLLNWKINKTKRDESRKKDEKIALEFKAKDVLIANAHENIEKIKAEAAKAKQESDEKIAELTTGAQRAGLKIAEAQATAATANEKAGELEKQNLELRSGVAGLEIEAADAKRKYLELEAKSKPRHLTTEQRDKFIAILKQVPKMPVAMYCGDPEACAFARHIAAALRASGWDDMQAGDGTELYAFSPPLIGITVTRRERDIISPQFMALHNALTAAGVPHQPGYNETIPAGLIEIRIGTKP
ncbi:MAG: hypothetical protein ABI977_25695 [Acidobacteriota bacterium]